MADLGNVLPEEFKEDYKCTPHELPVVHKYKFNAMCYGALHSYQPILCIGEFGK